MLIVRPLQLGALQRVLEQDRHFYLTASAYLGIDMETGEAIFDFQYLKGMVEAFGDDTPMLDFGMPKRQGEYLVTGAFHAPGGKPVPRGEVGVRVGDQAKVLDLFGEREWADGKSDPRLSPFDTLQISYQHAFGGAGYERNPDGVGFKDGKLPRIEHPAERVRNDGDRPEPAGLSVLDIQLPQRRRFQGTYNNGYLADYFPGHPVDMDWALFNCAAEDQWTKGFWRGDEVFEVRNMHPDHPVLKGRLPGLYARAFLKHRIGGAAPTFSELKLNCDTIWLFPGQKVALTIWRGVTEVGDDEARDVDALLVAYERRSDPPRSASHYEEALALREPGDDPLLNYFKTPDLIPVGAVCAMEGLQKMALEDTEPSALSQNMAAKNEAIQAEVDARIEEALKQVEPGLKDLPGDAPQADLDVRALLEKARKGDAEPDPDVKELHEKMEKILPGVTTGDPKKLQLKDFSFQKMDEIIALSREFAEKKKAVALAEMDKSRLEVAKQLEAVRAGELDMPEDAVRELERMLAMLEDLAAGRPMKAPLPRLDAEALTRDVDPTVLSAMQHLRGAKADEVDEAEIARMEELLNDAGRMAREAIDNASGKFREQYVRNAHFMPDGLSPHADPDEAVQARLDTLITAGGELAGGDFACLNLAGAQLDGRDLRGVFLEQADLTGASLKGALLDGAVLARATLDGADFTGASLKAANIGAVRARGTRFVDCDMVDARLGRGRFEAADFSGSDLTGSDMLEISITGCNFTNAIMPNRAFLEAKLDGCRFKGADLNTTMVAKSSCVGTDFSEANLAPVVFADTKLDGVIFDGANLEKLTVASAEEPVTMHDTRFRGAKLDKGCLRDMDLTGADFTGASLESTYFGGANLTRATLDGAQARFAQFRNAKMTGASCRDMDLREGSIAKAHVVSADFRGSNLYGSDVLRATFGETRFEGANLDRTLIQDWRPE